MPSSFSMFLHYVFAFALHIYLHGQVVEKRVELRAEAAALPRLERFQ
jgi:hypothetical protein